MAAEDYQMADAKLLRCLGVILTVLVAGVSLGGEQGFPSR